MIIPSLEAPEKRFPLFAAKAPFELSPFPFPLLDLESRQRHPRDILPCWLREGVSVYYIYHSVFFLGGRAYLDL